MNAHIAQRAKFIHVMKIISLSAVLPTRSIVSTCAVSMKSLGRNKSKDYGEFPIFVPLFDVPTFLFPLLSFTSYNRINFLFHSFSAIFKNLLAIHCTKGSIHVRASNVYPRPTTSFLVGLSSFIASIEDLRTRYQSKALIRTDKTVEKGKNEHPRT